MPSPESALTLIYLPFPSLEAARAACAALLAEQAVACCNLLTGAESHYIWEGELTQSPEIILIAKTTPMHQARAEAILRRVHPYTCPAILSFFAKSSPDFAAWVQQSLPNA